MQVSKDKVVTVEYTLTDVQGKIIDSSKDAGPLSYIHGMGNMIPGFVGGLGSGQGNGLKWYDKGYKRSPKRGL